MSPEIQAALIGGAIGAVPGLGALALSIYTFRHQRKREKAERSTANVVADVESSPARSGKGTDHRLILRNDGQAIARSVDAQMSVEGGPTLIREGLPIPQLHPGQEVSLLLIVSWGDGPMFEVAVEWEDDRGHQQRSYNVSIY